MPQLCVPTGPTRNAWRVRASRRISRGGRRLGGPQVALGDPRGGTKGLPRALDPLAAQLRGVRVELNRESATYSALFAVSGDAGFAGFVRKKGRCKGREEWYQVERSGTRAEPIPEMRADVGRRRANPGQARPKCCCIWVSELRLKINTKPGATTRLESPATAAQLQGRGCPPNGRDCVRPPAVSRQLRRRNQPENPTHSLFVRRTHPLNDDGGYTSQTWSIAGNGWSRRGQCWSMLTELGPSLASVGRIQAKLAKFGRTRIKFGQTRAEAGGF